MSNFKERDTRGLLPAQPLAIELLCSNGSVEEIAARCNVSRSTLWSWVANDDNFRLRLNETQRAKIEAATAKWVSMYEDAADVTGKALKGERVSSMQLQAAAMVTKRLPDLLEMSILHSRLVALEERLGVPQD